MASTLPLPLMTTTFGASLLGTFITSVMYGLTAHQTYRYYRQYPGDRLSIRLLVALLWVVDTLQSAFSMHFCYYYLVLRYNEPLSLYYGNWSLRLSVLLVSAPPFISNCFYVSRLWIIGQKNIFLISIILALIFGRLGFQLAVSVESFFHPLFSDFRRFQWMVKAYCASSVSADTILAACFCWTLNQRRTGYKRTDSKIDLLMIYTINTGSLTSLVCILALMSIVFVSQGFVYLPLHAVLGKLYVNTVLAVLNSRKPRRKSDESLYELAAFEGNSTRPTSGKLVFRPNSSAGSPINVQGFFRAHQETQLEEGINLDTPLSEKF